MYVRRMGVSSFLHQYFLRVSAKLKHLGFVGDSAGFTNLIVFCIKFFPLEMKMFVNIENSLWAVITPYSLYINDSISHFQCLLLSKLS